MIRIAALNDDVSDNGDDENFTVEKRTKEAQEAEAFALYNEALTLQQQNEVEQARQLYLQLLQLPLIKQVEPPDSAGPLQPNLALRYSTHKNLANIASQEGNRETAIENYLQAVLVDSTDVTVWHKISKLALSLHQYSLARHAYEQGLECNEKHWPCLDGVITVLYVLNNYEACLYYVGRALRRDSGYIKGLVFLHQILTEQPSLLKNTASYFRDCDPLIYDMEVDEEDMTEFVGEALEMRRKKQELAKIPDPPTVTFTQPHIAFTWLCLGESLIALYDHIVELVTRNTQGDATRPRVGLGCRVDLTSCVNVDPTAPVLESIPPPPTLPDTPSVAESQPASVSDVMASDAMLQDRLTDTGLADLDMQDLEGSIGRGRGQKRKRLQWEEAGKRRSARVRNTSQKKDEEEIVDYHELLSKILPLSLLQVRETEETAVVSDQPECPVDLSRTSMTGESQECFKGMDIETSKTSSESVSAREREAVEVHHFLETRQTNSGVLFLLRDFIFHLASRSRVKWSDGLSDVYCRSYGRLRAHFEYSSLFCKDVASDFKDMAQMCLVGCELKTDAWMVTRGKTAPSPGRSPSSVQVPSTAMADFPGKFFPQDVSYLVGLTNFPNLVGDSWREFCARVFWLKARFHTLENDMDVAIFYFDKTGEYLDGVERESEGSGGSQASHLEVDLPNCKTGQNITPVEVKKQLDSLRRCQSLEEVQRLHEAGDHEKVIQLLLSAQQKNKGVPVALPERPAQLLLLQDSLLKLNDYKRCLLWGEVSFHEGLRHYGGATSGAMQDDWANMIVQLLQGLDTILLKDITIINDLPSKNLVRLTTNLIQVIQINMDAPGFTTSMPVNTLLPWILLFRLIHHETTKSSEMVKSSEEPMEAYSEEEDLPPYALFLNVVHEYLGRRSWCVNCGGELLLAVVDVLMAELAKLNGDYTSTVRSGLEMTIEQCFYCLYGHPAKRTKAKHLQDHTAKKVELTWERSFQLFEYFKPKTVPEFDSYKTSTVSNELENLLRRISALVPDHCNPVNTLDSLTAYIDGLTEKPPTGPKDKDITTPVVKELYYLLADYYFKNKEQTKAIKFYQLDLCVIPDRMDSWAGMALARASRLQQKLNSHELKPEWPVLKHAGPILRCFKRALELDESNSKLWIEYGSLAYELHSFASRQLKLQDIFPLSSDACDSAVTYRETMLETAGRCYQEASECDGDDSAEEWLHHYMLGKVAEKLLAPPATYLEHYKQAAEHLHEDQAKYPKRITYSHHVFASPYLAVESLEVYYRMHVCVMKHLLRHDKDVPYALFESYLKEAAEGPFANCREKDKRETKSASRSDMFDDQLLILAPSSWTTPSGMVPPSGRVTPHSKSKGMVQADHSYSKRKMSSESSGQSSQESADVPNNPLPMNLPPPILSPVSTKMVTQDDISTPVMTSPPKLLKLLPPLNKSVSPSSLHTTGSLIDVMNLSVATPEGATVPPPASPAPQQMSIKHVFNNMISDMIAKHLLSDGNPASSLATDPARLSAAHQGAPVKALPTLPSLAEEQPGSDTVERSRHSSPTSALCFGSDTSKTTDKNKDVDVTEAAPMCSERIEPVSSQNDGDHAELLQAAGPDSKDEPMDIIENPTLDPIPSSPHAASGAPSPASGATMGGTPSVTPSVQNDTPTTVKCEDKKESSIAEDINKSDTTASVCANTPSKTEADEKQTGGESEANVTVKSEESQTDMKRDDKPSVEDEPAVDEATRHVRLITMCIKAFALCLNRFPQHYKSLYRLAYVYFHCPHHKNVEWSRNLLLGTAQWSQLDYMPSPGLLQDRKQTNFFQGLWRMPIAEIDRSGSFAAHLTRSLLLLFDVLRESHDSHMLFYINTQLARAPDPLKKYIRDTDRLKLSQVAYQHCMRDIRRQIKQHLADGTHTPDVCQALLLDIHRTRQYAMKTQMQVEMLNKLLVMIYEGCRKNQLDKEPAVLEQALRYCQQLVSSKPPTTPTGEVSRCLPSVSSGPGPSLMSSPLALPLPAEGTKDVEQRKNSSVSQTTPTQCPVSALMAYRPPMRGVIPHPVFSRPPCPTSPRSPRPRPMGRPRLSAPFRPGGMQSLPRPQLGARPGIPGRGMGMTNRDVGMGLSVIDTQSLKGIVGRAMKDPTKSNSAVVQEILQKVCAETTAIMAAPPGGHHTHPLIPRCDSPSDEDEPIIVIDSSNDEDELSSPEASQDQQLHVGVGKNQPGQLTSGVNRQPGQLTSGVSRQPGQLTSGVSRQPGHLTSGVSRRSGQLISGVSRQPGHLTSGISRQPGHLTSGISRQPGQLTPVVSRQPGQLTSGVSRHSGQLTSGVSRQPGQLTSGVSRQPGQLTSGLCRQLGQLTSGVSRQPGQLTCGVNRHPGQLTSGVSRQPDQLISGVSRLKEHLTCDVQIKDNKAVMKPKSLQEKIEELARQAAVKAIHEAAVVPPSTSPLPVTTHRKIKTTAPRKPSSFSMDSLLATDARTPAPHTGGRMPLAHSGGIARMPVANPGGNVRISGAPPGVSYTRPNMTGVQQRTATPWTMQTQRGNNIYHLVAPSGVSGQDEDVIVLRNDPTSSGDDSDDFVCC